MLVTHMVYNLWRHLKMLFFMQQIQIIWHHKLYLCYASNYRFPLEPRLRYLHRKLSTRYQLALAIRDTSWHFVTRQPSIACIPKSLARDSNIFTPEFISAILHGRICARILLIMTCFLIETVLRRGSGVIRSAIMHSRSNFAAIGSEHNWF